MNLAESVLRFHEFDRCGGAASTLIHPHFAIACFHSFNGIPTKIFLETYKGFMLAGPIRHYPFPLLDLMILELAQPVIDVKPIQFSKHVSDGDACRVLGFPLINNGIFCATLAKITLSREETNRHVYQFLSCPTDKRVLKGTSGGPVVNSRGEIMAMQQSTDLPPDEGAFYGSGLTSEIIYNFFMKVKGKAK